MEGQAVTERERFEAWAHSEGFNVRRMVPVDPNKYASLETEDLWTCWQAAQRIEPSTLDPHLSKCSTPGCCEREPSTEFVAATNAEYEKLGTLRRVVEERDELKRRVRELEREPSTGLLQDDLTELLSIHDLGDFGSPASDALAAKLEAKIRAVLQQREPSTGEADALKAHATKSTERIIALERQLFEVDTAEGCEKHGRWIKAMQESLHRKNVELTALRYVWCDGNCEPTERYGVEIEPLTEEVVAAAERAVVRMRRKLSNLTAKHERATQPTPQPAAKVKRAGVVECACPECEYHRLCEFCTKPLRLHSCGSRGEYACPPADGCVEEQ